MTVAILQNYQDPSYNKICGLTLNHAYAILAAFELKNKDGFVEHQLIMIRDPRNINYYDEKWNKKDLWIP